MSQEKMILSELKSRGPRGLTALDAFKMGCFRLAARIHVLRGQGHEIFTELVKEPNGVSYARYTLIKEKKNG